MTQYIAFDGAIVEHGTYGKAHLKGRIPLLRPTEDWHSKVARKTLEEAEKSFFLKYELLFEGYPAILEEMRSTGDNACYLLSSLIDPHSEVEDLKLTALLTCTLIVIDRLALGIKQKFQQHPPTPEEKNNIIKLSCALQNACDGHDISETLRDHKFFELLNVTAKAIHDMRALANTYSSDIEFFIYELRQWVQVCFREVGYAIDPGLNYTSKDYSFCRPYSAAGPLYIEALILIARTPLSKEKRAICSLALRKFMEDIGLVIGLANDLISLKKEVGEGEEDNLAFLIAKERLSEGAQDPLKEGIQVVQKKLEDSSKNLESTKSILRAQFPDTDEAIEACIRIGERLQDGASYWMAVSGTKRYGKIQYEIPDLQQASREATSPSTASFYQIPREQETTTPSAPLARPF